MAQLVKDPQKLIDVFTQLATDNDALVFWNHERSLLLMLRNDPVDEDDAIGTELVIINEEAGESGRLTTILETEYEGYYDDYNPEFFVMKSFVIPKGAAPDDPSVLTAVKQTNALYATSVCGCTNYLARGPGHCTFCHLTAAAEDLCAVECPICREEGPKFHMCTQACCGKTVHKKCMAKWKSSCPFCRAE